MLNLGQIQNNNLNKQISYKGSNPIEEYGSEEKLGYALPVTTAALIGASTTFMNPTGPAGQIASTAKISRFSLSAQKIGEKILSVKNTIFKDIATSNIALILVKSKQPQPLAPIIAAQIMANPQDTTQILRAANIKETFIIKYNEYMASVTDILSKESEGVASLGAKIRNPKLIFAALTSLFAAGVAAFWVRKSNKDIESAEL